MGKYNSYCAIGVGGSHASIVKSMLSDIPNLEALSISSYFAFLFLLIVNVRNGMFIFKEK